METSAGILIYRLEKDNTYSFFLTHFGGPLFKNKRQSWGIPKGHVEDGENLMETAKREFKEETGIDPSGYELEKPAFITFARNKQNVIFSAKGVGNEKFISSNSFELNGKEYPENDTGRWVNEKEYEDISVSFTIMTINNFIRKKKK